MRAERRAGELLREMEKNGGARDGEQKDGPPGCITLRHGPEAEAFRFCYFEVAMSRWQQKLAALSARFEAQVKQTLALFETNANYLNPFGKKRRRMTGAGFLIFWK
jgi:hypothetical protein